LRPRRAAADRRAERDPDRAASLGAHRYRAGAREHARFRRRAGSSAAAPAPEAPLRSAGPRRAAAARGRPLGRAGARGTGGASSACRGPSFRCGRCAVIGVEHVSHWFGSMQVLRDLSMRVPAGEIFGFIGPNGAGKTTTIRMMATLLEPDDGRVLVDGLDVCERPSEVRRVLGFMPDGFGVYERVTIREYLELFAAAQ